MLTRRDHLRQLASAALAATTPRWLRGQSSIQAHTPGPSLREAAAAVGLVYGSCSDMPFHQAPPAYLDLFLRQCALFAPILSWQDVAPTPTSENDAFDPNAAVALDHGLRLTGAHLLW
ncbi:MAG: hypothetical protein WBP95_05290, partial [Acidobacteriaceae bacterium]